MYQKNEDFQMLYTYENDGSLKDVEEIKEVVKITKRHFKKGEFYMQTFSLDDFIIEKNYNSYEIKTLISLKRRLDYNNRIKTFRQKDIAQEIKSSQSNVSLAMRRLQEDKIIYKDGLDWYFSETYIKGAGDNSAKKKQRKY